MEKLQDMINSKKTEKAANQAEFEQVQQQIMSKAASVNLKPLDGLLSKYLDQIATQLVKDPDESAYSVFSLFKKKYIFDEGVQHISDGYNSLIDYGVYLQDKFAQLREKADTLGYVDDELTFERIVWDKLAPRIVRYFNGQDLGAKIVGAWLYGESSTAYQLCNISPEEKTELEGKYEIDGRGHGFFIIKGMPNPDQTSEEA